MRAIAASVGLLVLGACAAQQEKPQDLVQGIAAGTGGTMMFASGTGGVPPAGTGGSTPIGSGGMGSGGMGSGGMGAAGMGSGGMGSGGMGSGGMGSGGMGSGGMGSGGMGSGGMGSGGATGSGAPTVSVEFTTISYGGEYAPFNYDAVWFEKKDGTFVKTVARWAGAAHTTDLAVWTAASGGWGSIFGGGNTADMMDAMSSATLRMHEMHMVTWNMKDAAKMLVPDGDYVCVLEMSEDRALANAEKVVRIPFTKGPQPQTVDPPDPDSYSGVHLQYTP